MWLLEFLFLIMTLLIGWTLFGYFLFLWSKVFSQQRATPIFPRNWPVLSLVIPCYNEQAQILNKLQDIRQLDYPHDRLEVVFADGGSSDQTVELLHAALKPEEPFQIICCPHHGKINQLNHVLPKLRGQIIVNTDVDARLSPDALKWIAAEFALDPSVWVVGAYSHPTNTLEIERYYWDAQNKGRFLESDAGTTSIVIAQCYAFRRELLSAFPTDVVADDIYVAFLASTLGYRVVYSRYAIAIETRSPQSYTEFLPHKFRKSNAFLRESLRFLYRLPDMEPFCKLMFVTRTAQQLLLPWALAFWMTIAGVLINLLHFDIVIMGAIFLVLLLMLTNLVFTSTRLPDEEGHHYAISTMLIGYVLTNLIMLATGLSYPFFRQNSLYKRLATETGEYDREERREQRVHARSGEESCPFDSVYSDGQEKTPVSLDSPTILEVRK